MVSFPSSERLKKTKKRKVVCGKEQNACLLLGSLFFSGRFLSSQSNVRVQNCSYGFSFPGKKVHVYVLKGSPFFTPQMKDCLRTPPPPTTLCSLAYDFIFCSFICLRPQMSTTLELCNLIFQKNSVYLASQSAAALFNEAALGHLIGNISEEKTGYNFPYSLKEQR